MWKGWLAVLAALAMVLPTGVAQAQEVAVGEWATGSWGQVRLTGIANQNEVYAEGDVLRLAYRVEANLPEITNMRVTSDEVVNAAACNWRNLPAGTAGRYNCGYTASSVQEITYTITAEDVAAGEATFSTHWSPLGVSGTEYPTITVTTRVAAGEPVPFEWPELVEGEPRKLAGPGDFGFTCHRIPALTEAPNGWLLASWDGRPGSCQDAPQANSIIQRISTDGGKSWGDPTTIAAGFRGDATTGRFGYSDPSYVVDRETGTIFNFFVKSYDVSFQASQPGVDPDQRNVLHAVVVHSTDNGLTWSEPRNITADITADVDNWRSRFAASGEGIQLRYGEHAGRLLQQYTIATVEPATYRAVSVYSDDHGATWQVGEPVGTGMDENKVVELSDGTVMLNSRRSDAVGGRKVALSTDGGHTYGEVTIDHTLVDPRNNASIIRAYPEAAQGSDEAAMLLFSNANSSSSRTNGTVRLSLDDGATWSASKVFAPGDMAYSTLTPLSEPGTYGLLYEGQGPSIQYMQVSLDWLDYLPVKISGEEQRVHRGKNDVEFTLTNLSAEERTVDFAVTGPAGWTVGEVAPVTIPADGTATVEVPVTVPESTDPGVATFRATASQGELTSTGQLEVGIMLLPGQHPTRALDVELVSELPYQSGEDPSKMFDGDVNTLWHSPWGSSVTLPLDIDLRLPADAGELAALRYTPRPSGSNGRIAGYEVYAGDDLASLELVEQGQWANTGDVQSVALAGTAGYVRLRILSTYGDQSNRVFASAAELGVQGLVPDDAVPTPNFAHGNPNGAPTKGGKNG